MAQGYFMKKYDFILFEHSGARNHHRDLEEIASLMMSRGMRVAIAEVYQEKKFCRNTDIEHYYLKKSFSQKTYSEGDCRFSLLRFLLNRFVLMSYHKYLRYVMSELSEVTSNIYVGSFFNDNLYNWIKGVDSDINVYLWGLRSFWLFEYKKKPFSIPGFFSFFNRNLLSKHPNFKLFVSNEIIRDEYLELGISPSRLIVRPERTALQLVGPIIRNDNKLRLLTIGSLRPDKRIELTAKALQIIDSKEISFVIAGATDPKYGYEEVINLSINKLSGVIRINHRLNDDEYWRILDECDFLVLCDKQQPSCITNGTMDEALLRGKPIIAPNYNPYKYIIDKFKVGISFDPDSVDSLVTAIITAKKRGTYSFFKEIEQYQKHLLFETVSKDFVHELGYSPH